MLHQEESLWAQKAKQKWLVEDDRNTVYFQASVKARRIQSQILKIKTDKGDWVSDPNTIADLGVQHFCQIFNVDQQVINPSIVPGIISKPVSAVDNDNLTQLPSMEEVQRVVMEMNHSSSPGPDGFSGQFFSHCWDIIKDDLLSAILSFFNGTDIPKVKNIESFHQLRPIPFCYFCFKVITRLINDRLSVLLPSFIYEVQSGFVKGRGTHDNILIAYELTQHLDSKNDDHNVIIKLDMSKAYDRLS